MHDYFEWVSVCLCKRKDNFKKKSSYKVANCFNFLNWDGIVPLRWLELRYLNEFFSENNKIKQGKEVGKIIKQSNIWWSDSVAENAGIVPLNKLWLRNLKSNK